MYYEQCPPEPAQNKVTQPLQQPNNTAQVKPPLLQNQNQKQQQQTKTPHEVQAAKDEAAKAAQEAAKAAKEASKGLFKGLTSFGGNVKNQAQQQQQQAQGKGGGGLFGGIMKAAASTAAQAATGPEPPKPKQPVLKPQNPNFPKPYTNNMTAKQRWQWAYRRIVQVKATCYTSLLSIILQYIYNILTLTYLYTTIMSDMKIYNYTIPYLSLVFYYFLLIT